MTQKEVADWRCGRLRTGLLYVGRVPGKVDGCSATSKWANPFKVGVHGNLEGVLRAYEGRLREGNLADDWEELQGKVLLCHCKDDAPATPICS